MTQKDFVAIARGLHGVKPAYLHEDETDATEDEQRLHRARFVTWHATVLAVADVFSAMNSRFDHSRFIMACEKGGA